MEDVEIRLRLIEAAAQLPAVRMHTDDKLAAATAHAMADVWYNNFVKVINSEKSKPVKPAAKKKELL